MSPPRRFLALQLALALVTSAVYWPVSGHEFVNYDDDLYVTDNELVLRGITREGVTWALTTAHIGNWHPLAWLSHMLDVELFGAEPAGHHLASAALHVAATLLLFRFFARTTGALGPSAFVAAVFALHPLHVESVAWVSERKDVLAGVFWMLTLCAYARYCRRPSGGRYVLVAALFGLGLTAKPMLVTLPCVLLLLDYWPLGRLGGSVAAGQAGAQRLDPALLRRRALEKLPLLGLAAASSAITFAAQAAGDTVADFERAPWGLRLGNALVAYCAYLGNAFWPANLGVLYPHPGEVLPGWMVGGSALVLVGLTSWVLRRARAEPPLVVGWLWYLGTLVPVIGLIQVGAQGMADRYTYLPLVGLALMVAWGVPARLAGWRRAAPVSSAAALVALAALSAVTSLQLRHWRDSATLFEQALRARRNAWIPFPDSPILHYNLGVAYTNQERFEEAAAQYRAAIALGSEGAQVHNNLANALVHLGRSDEAIAHYREALARDPEHLTAHFNYGVVLVARRRFEEAASHYERYLGGRPEDAGARRRLAEALAREGRIDAALRLYEEALALEPDVPTRVALGTALWRAGRHAEAIGGVSRALADAPGDPVLVNNLAWMLATCPDASLRDPERALELAERAMALDPGPGSLDTLAAAYATAGRFPDAIRTARAAVAAAEESGDAGLAGRLRERLALYEAGRAFVEAAGR